MERKPNHVLAEQFTDDPQKNLEIENEILKMKMQAEAGAVIDIKDDFPPELENLFLRSVIAVEEASRSQEMISLYDFLGRPDYKPVADLLPEEIEPELERLKQIIDEKQVIVDILDTYEPAAIYKFITEELFRQETCKTLVPGMLRHFTYEAFHPNHKLDIRERTIDFLGDWFERKMDEHSWELNAEFILPDAKVLKRDEVVQKIKTIFAAYTCFIKCKYAIGEIGFEWNEKEKKGLGFCEGAVKYEALLENGEAIPIEGPFKMYLSNDGGWWSIFYFIFPGFVW